MYSDLLLTTEAGKMEIWRGGGKVETIFHQKEMAGAMGLISTKTHYFVNTPLFLYKVDRETNKVVKKSQKFNAQFHHMNLYEGTIYASGTFNNKIYLFNKELKHIDTKAIAPPKKNQAVAYKSNYNHINSVIRHDDKFYVNLNWFTQTQYGMSGVVVFNKDWKEIDRFEMGWESHDFQFYDGKPIVICATSNPDKKINHPKKSGIMLDGKLVWEHDSNEAFCKGLCWDDNYFYLCGGMKAKREDRRYSKGIIYIVDKNNFETVAKITDSSAYNIKGCRILS